MRMSSEPTEYTNADSLVLEGIKAIKVQETAQAYDLLSRAIRLNPRCDKAWLWLSAVVETDEKRSYCLQQALKINPENAAARQGLERLAPSAPEPASPPVAPTPTPANTVPPPTTPPADQPGQLEQPAPGEKPFGLPGTLFTNPAAAPITPAEAPPTAAAHPGATDTGRPTRPASATPELPVLQPAEDNPPPDVAKAKAGLEKLIKQRQYSAAHTPDEWLTALQQVVQHDLEWEGIRKIAQRTMVGTFLLFLLPILGVAILGLPESLVLVSFVFFGIIFLAALIVFLIAKSHDIPDMLRTFVVPTFSVLREDMEPGEPIHMTIDLRGSMHNAKKTDEQRFSLPSYSGKRRRAVESYYTDPWLNCHACLSDGTTLQWQITQYVRKRVITSTGRSRSGKTKTKSKTKYKSRSRLDMQVGLRQKYYTPQDDQPLLVDDHEITLKKSNDKRNTFRVRRAIVSSDVEDTIGVPQFLEAIKYAYQRVSLARDGH
jgi:hypothetical protein